MLENPNHAKNTTLQTRQQKIPGRNTLQNPIRGRANRNQNTRGMGDGARGRTDCGNGIGAGSSSSAATQSQHGKGGTRGMIRAVEQNLIFNFGCERRGI